MRDKPFLTDGVVGYIPARGMGAEMTLGQLPRPLVVPEGLSDRRLLDAVRIYLQGASGEEVSVALGLEEGQKLSWFEGDREWVALCNLLLPQVREAMVAQLASLESKALGELRDRLEHGEEMMGPDGVKLGVKRRLRAREIVAIYGEFARVRERMETRLAGLPTEEERISLREHLKALKRFARSAEVEGERVR